jgi:hypothetical protein
MSDRPSAEEPDANLEKAVDSWATEPTYPLLLDDSLAAMSSVVVTAAPRLRPRTAALAC